MRLELLELVNELWKDVKENRWVELENEKIGGEEVEMISDLKKMGENMERRKKEGVEKEGDEMEYIWKWEREEDEIKGIDEIKS